MPVIYFLIAATFIFAAACVLLRRKNKSFEGMICKFMASFGFISVAVFGNYLQGGEHIKYFSFIVFALMFGFCGDVFLGVKEIAPTFKKKLIPIGLAYFLVGHIFCLFAFSSLSGFEPKTVIALPVVGLIAYGLIKLFKLKLKGAFCIVCCIYYGILAWKIAMCIYLVITDMCIANILALIGSCFFMASDTCLAFLYFTPVKKKNALVTAELSTYYTAQLLIAMSVAIR
ncbi:MAG: hypothetical protein IKS04_02295 [Clostridia bacterium]|nr:hypothetical protein [Clostridia bacterium]MBR6701806.1 hypothetical protein [Clostridia bacterium]